MSRKRRAGEPRKAPGPPPFFGRSAGSKERRPRASPGGQNAAGHSRCAPVGAAAEGRRGSRGEGGRAAQPGAREPGFPPAARLRRARQGKGRSSSRMAAGKERGGSAPAAATSVVSTRDRGAARGPRGAEAAGAGPGRVNPDGL